MALDNQDDFFTSTSTVPDVIGDQVETPPPVPGMMPMGDPMRPWKEINVKGYMPLATMVIRKPFAVAADKMKEPTMALDDEEQKSLQEPLEEALQKCLYDLKLGSLAGHPYVALALAAGGLGTVKYLAVQARRLLELEEAQKRSQEHGHQPLPSATMSPQAMPPDSPTTSTRTRASGAVSFAAGSPAAENPISFVNGSDEGDA